MGSSNSGEEYICHLTTAYLRNSSIRATPTNIYRIENSGERAGKEGSEEGADCAIPAIASIQLGIETTDEEEKIEKEQRINSSKNIAGMVASIPRIKILSTMRMGSGCVSRLR